MNDLFSKSVIRTPVKCFEYYQEILNYDKRDLFKLLIKDDFFLNALHTASPVFYSEFIKQNENSFSENQKMVLTCIKYIIRLSTRCTPFGLFSGNLVVEHGNDISECNIERSPGFIIHTRLDANLYQMFYENLEKDHNIRQLLRYYTNTSLYKHNNNYRYVEFTHNQQNGKRKYELTQVTIDIILKNIINNCSHGTKYPDLIKYIEDFGYERDEAAEYVNELIDSQIIISELSQSSIGGASEVELLKKLEKIQEEFNVKILNEKIEFLKYIIDKEETINNSDQHISLENTKDLNAFFENQFPNKKNKVFLHKEINFTTQSNLPVSYDKFLQDASYVLDRIGDKSNIEEMRISKFKRLFVEKYGDSIQKLTDVLDAESGIGYGEFLNSGGIDDNPIIFNLQNSTSEYKNNVEIYSKDNYLISSIKKAIKNNLNVKLEESELKSYNPDGLKLGATFAYFGELYKDHDNKDIFYIKGIASSPINLLGRFTNSSEKITELVHEISTFEHEFFKDFICAEVDYIPESTLGNVILRKKFRGNHISYLASPVMDGNISIQDIYISVRNHKVVLTNEENKAIMPFYSNAFNINHPKNLPLFELLADIKYQYDYTNSKNLNIDKYHQFLDHIPRIEYKNIVLRRASWIIKFSELKKSQNVHIKGMKMLLSDYKVNRYITFEEWDNELLIDIENTYTLEILLKELEKKGSLILREYLLSEFKSAVKVNNKDVNNEIIFCKKNLNNSNEHKITIPKKRNIKQTFSPGSEWVYFKIYIGNKTADDLLIKLDKTIKDLIRGNFIKSFFYIKYTEDSFQLRLRLRLTKIDNFVAVFNAISSLLEKWKSNKRIHKFSLETYERELDRYGYSQIENFEEIFFKDSLLSLDFIKYSKTSDIPAWLFCAEYIFNTINALFNDRDKALEFIDFMKSSYDIEFNSNKHTTKSINQKYNDHKNILTEVFFKKNTLLQESTTLCYDILELLNKVKYSSKQEFFSYLGSVFHMHVIRVVRTNNRLYEYLIYSFLLKIIKTQIAVNLQYGQSIIK